MHRLLNILSQAWSIILYPMFMPLYGILLFCYATQTSAPKLPAIYLLICVLGTCLLTVIIPITLLLYLRHKGYINSLHINDPKQRTTPYIYTIVCYGFWAYFLRATMQLPLFLLIVVIGAIIALIIVTLINHFWKISAHLTGIGGLLGGVCSYAIYYSRMPFYLIISILLAALLLMYARIYLNAHTPMQVVCGFLLGIITTFLPTLIIFYA